LSDFALSLTGELPEEIIVRTTDNRELFIDTANDSYKYVYFLGEYEPTISGVLSELIKPGDICLDIGANIGWYTTLFQKLVGNDGEVHAFEPVPPIFEHLKRNVRLNEAPANVQLNKLALGDVEKNVSLHIFPNLPNGHASISNFDRGDCEVFPSRMVTLDYYLSKNRIENVNLVKIDIEGAELMMLMGASKLFHQNQLPIFEIEMALETTRGFGYLPNDLIEFIGNQAEYLFFEIDEKYSKVRQIKGFEPQDIGANVLCLPYNFDVEILSNWLS
jgi:FkbM family methyltransferase